MDHELQTQLILIRELNLVSSDSKIDELLNNCVEIQKMIYSFKSKI